MTDPPASALQPGQLLAGKYRIERVIGRGGMGLVYCAHHVHLEERVAIKILLPEALTEEARGRFLREARAAVKIKSEHIARVFDVGTLESGEPYIVMEYLEGGDLAGWLQKEGPLPVEQAAEFVVQACEALAEAHSLGIVHRDLKPSNLFWVRRADDLLAIKVLDFGISKVTGANESHNMTRTAALVGSPHYMSPEQMQSSRGVDSRTDIWSLGVILFELIAGRVPFDAKTITELAVMVVSSPPEKTLGELRGGLPRGFEQVVMRCLAKDREARYANVAEVAQALAPFAPSRLQGSIDRTLRILRVSNPGGRTSQTDGPTSSSIPDMELGHKATVASWNTQSGMRQGGRTMFAMVAGAALLAGVAGVTLVVRGGRPAEAGNGVSTPQPPTPRPSSTLADPAAQLAPEATASAGSAASSTSAAPPATAPSVPSPPPPRPPVGTTTPPGPAVSGKPPPKASAGPKGPGCNPPYFLNDQGFKQYKPECL